MSRESTLLQLLRWRPDELFYRDYYYADEAGKAALLTRTDADGTARRTKKVDAQRLDRFCDVFLSVLSDTLRLQNGVKEIRNTDCADLEKNFAAGFTTAQIQSMIQIASEAKEMLVYKASAALTLDWILAKLP